MELELRLILLAIGLVIIGLIYAWGMRKSIKEGLERRRRLKKQRSSETLMDAMPAIDTSGANMHPKESADDEIAVLDEFEVRVIDRTTEYKEKTGHRDALGGVSNPSVSVNSDQSSAGPVSETSFDSEELSTAKPDLEDAAASPEKHVAESELDPIVSSVEKTDRGESETEMPNMTVLLTVLAPSGQSFSGAAIRKVARELALPLGEQGVLECNTDAEAGKRPKTVFSVAHLREPGTFDAKTFDTLSTPGLLLFLSLPGPLSATEAVRIMFGVAGQLAEKLGGTVCDEKRRRFTRDGYVELHRRASQFEQQTMSEA